MNYEQRIESLANVGVDVATISAVRATLPGVSVTETVTFPVTGRGIEAAMSDRDTFVRYMVGRARIADGWRGV